MKDIEVKEITITISPEDKKTTKQKGKGERQNGKGGFPWGFAAVLSAIGGFVAFLLGKPYLMAAFTILLFFFSFIGMYISFKRLFDSCDGTWWERLWR